MGIGDNMNKLLGFYELRDSMLPTIPWKQYVDGTILETNIFWTVRMAVHHGEDLNLPRRVGVTAEEATKFAKLMIQKYGENGIVIYYPYFLAEKSGTLNIFGDRIVIEAVKEDLWNLLTYSKKDVTIIVNGNETQYIGKKDFINVNELEELMSYVKEVKYLFRDEIVEGKSILLEWSYAYKCDLNKNRMGERYLVFYEARTV